MSSTTDIDLEKIIALGANDQIGKNADSLLGMLQEANKVLGELDKILAFVKKLEGSILVSVAVQAQAKKAGLDLKPLSTPDIVPPSEAHKQICENICKMSPAQLQEMLGALVEYDKRKHENTKT